MAGRGPHCACSKRLNFFGQYRQVSFRAAWLLAVSWGLSRSSSSSSSTSEIVTGRLSSSGMMLHSHGKLTATMRTLCLTGRLSYHLPHLTGQRRRREARARAKWRLLTSSAVLVPICGGLECGVNLLGFHQVCTHVFCFCWLPLHCFVQVL